MDFRQSFFSCCYIRDVRVIVFTRGTSNNRSWPGCFAVAALVAGNSIAIAQSEFSYECIDSVYEMDCANNPTLLSNGQEYSFVTAGANTDGPDDDQCNSLSSQTWSDLWFKVSIAGAGRDYYDLVASCCGDATFNTKITIYDAGPTGSSVDLDRLPELRIECNDDCGAGPPYTSLAASSVLDGRDYLVRIGGELSGQTGSGTLRVAWTATSGPLPAPECVDGGVTVVSHIISEPPTLAQGVWCGAGSENVVARTFSALELGTDFAVRCVDFGYDVVDGDAYFPCIINLYRSNQMSPLGATTELLGTASCGIYGPANAAIGSQQFSPPVSVALDSGQFLMVEVRFQRQSFGGVGYGGFAGVTLSQTDGTEGYVSCGGSYLGSMSEVGFPDYQPYIVVRGGPLDCGEADSDGDGTFDLCDLCPDDPEKVYPGTCGCGVADTDTDSDGTLDCLDGCPLDQAKIEPGDCGCGTPDTGVFGDVDCDGDYDRDDALLAMSTFGIAAGDMDSDGDLDRADFEALKVAIGIRTLGCAVVDINADGVIDGQDMAYLLSYWGDCR